MEAQFQDRGVLELGLRTIMEAEGEGWRAVEAGDWLESWVWRASGENSQWSESWSASAAPLAGVAAMLVSISLFTGVNLGPEQALSRDWESAPRRGPRTRRRGRGGRRCAAAPRRRAPPRPPSPAPSCAIGGRISTDGAAASAAIPWSNGSMGASTIIWKSGAGSFVYACQVRKVLVPSRQWRKRVNTARLWADRKQQMQSFCLAVSLKPSRWRGVGELEGWGGCHGV